METRADLLLVLLFKLWSDRLCHVLQPWISAVNVLPGHGTGALERPRKRGSVIPTNTELSSPLAFPLIRAQYTKPIIRQPFKQLHLIPNRENSAKAAFKSRAIWLRVLSSCRKSVPRVPSFYMTPESFKVWGTSKKSRCASCGFSACQQCILNQIVILIPHKHRVIGQKTREKKTL